MKADIINEKYFNILILTGFYYHFIFINFYFHSKDNSIYCKHLKHFPANNLIPVLRPVIEYLKLVGYRNNWVET